MGSDCLSRKAARVALDSRSARPATTKRMRQYHPVAFLTKHKPQSSCASAHSLQSTLLRPEARSALGTTQGKQSTSSRTPHSS